MTEGTGVYRVIASFHTRAAFGLAISHVVTGVLILLCGCVVFGVQAFTSVGGTSLLTGVPLIGCGVLGYFSSQRKEIWLITAYLLVSICALIFSLALVGAGATGVQFEPDRDSNHPVQARQALDVVCIVLAVIAGVSLIWSTILCSMALFYGCCKPVSGATYVTDPAKSEDQSAQNPSETNHNKHPESEPQPANAGPAVLEI